MDNVELSPATRWGMIATGLLQGLVCYLLIAWLAGKNLSWIVYGVPATVAFSSVLLFSVISFKQNRLWGWLALVFIATLGMSGLLKWQTDGMTPWRAEKALWDFGCYLLLMAMLLLPWIQQSLRIRNDSSRYRYFYQSVWHNVLILLVIFLANGLTWLVLLLWSELFKLVGITFFKTLFFATDWFIYLTLGLVTALAVLVLLVWSLGYFVSIVWRKGQNPLDLQGKVNLAVSLLVLVILVLLNSPVLDSMRISVNSHMARYQSGKNTPDQVTIYMLEQSGRYGRAALESLKSDAEYMKDPKRARDLLMALDGEQHLQEQVSEKVLADNVLIAPGSGKPDATFWSALIQDRYNVMTCIEKDACVLVEQDLNSDGQAERILFAFNDDRVIVYGFDSARKEWDALDMSLLPRKITKEKLLTAAKDGKLGTRPKAWRDLTVDGETLEINLSK